MNSIDVFGSIWGIAVGSQLDNDLLQIDFATLAVGSCSSHLPLMSLINMSTKQTEIESFAKSNMLTEHST